MSLTTWLLIVLLLAAVAVLPGWPYSAQWGYGPSAILAAVLLVVGVLFVLGRI